jgi:hypothetical protein
MTLGAFLHAIRVAAAVAALLYAIAHPVIPAVVLAPGLGQAASERLMHR